MPQLDIGSYRTQVNALVRTFGRRYRTRAGIGLPKVARAIKRRSRKTDRGRSQGETGTMHKVQAEDAYGKELGSGLHTASEVLNTSRDMHLQWRNGHALAHRKSISSTEDSRKPSKKDIRTKRIGLRASDDKEITISKSKTTLSKLKTAKSKRRKSLKKRRKQVADVFKVLTSGKPKKNIKVNDLNKTSKVETKSTTSKKKDGVDKVKDASTSKSKAKTKDVNTSKASTKTKESTSKKEKPSSKKNKK